MIILRVLVEKFLRGGEVGEGQNDAAQLECEDVGMELNSQSKKHVSQTLKDFSFL